MFQLKQTAFQTLETHKNSQNFGSRMNEIRYNINDYLPTDYDYRPSHRYQMPYKDYFQMLSLKKKTEDVQDDGSYKQLISSLSQTIKQQESQIQRLTKQLKQQQMDYEQKSRKANQQLDELLQKLSSLQIAAQTNKHRSELHQQNLKKEQKERQQIYQQLCQIKKQMSKKLKNIRIFCQKYQVTVQPKKKQFYTIEVQTQKQQRVPMQQNHCDDIHNESRFNTIEPICHRKISCHNKPQFFQLYQQQLNEPNQQNGQITSRSQIISSNSKLKKPSFLHNIMGEYNDKENDRRKVNQRIDGKDKQKIKIKNQEIQICPIDQIYIEDIVKGILATK